MKDILVSGRAIPMQAFIHRSPMLTFNVGMRTETRAVALHWTGGEGGGDQVHRVLRERGLSVQFFIDQEGHIWQYADASARCAHIGSANGYTVGIEIANRANGKPSIKWPRQPTVETVHGHRFHSSAFYPAQVAAATELTQTLCKAYGLPYEAPACDTVLSDEELRAVRGVLGHFHVSRKKVDPGTLLLQGMGLRA